MVGHQVLVLAIGVRIPVPELYAGVLAIGVRIPVPEHCSLIRIKLKSMSIKRPKINIQENIQAIDRLGQFEKNKTPEELLTFMKENIEYGF